MSVKNRIITLSSVILLLLATPYLASAQETALSTQGKTVTRTQKYVELVSSNDILRESSFGILAMTAGGDTVAAWNPNARLTPASNMKLIATGAAMHRLGPDFKYVTRLGITGEIKEGTLEGDLYIVGGGDPTIASKDSIALRRETLFSQWKSFLDKAGIKRINGRVIGDGRYFDGPIEEDSWLFEDIGTAYGTGGNGLCFYENAIDFKVSAGAAVGSQVNITPSYPSAPWMTYTYSCKTGPAGTGDQLYYFTSEFAPKGEIRGSFAIDRNPKTEEFSNKFGSYTCAYYFCEYLKTNGITAALGPADVYGGHVRSDLSSSETGPWAAKVDDLVILGTTESPSLKRIARLTNLKSDNFYAETLFRTLGRRLHHSASYDSSKVAMNETLASIGADPSKVRIADGSGLSRMNYVSPAFFTEFLRAMMESPIFEDYIETIGQPGGRHYESLLRNEPDSIKARIHLKSGFMTGVRCFSGYIEPSEGAKDDTIVFSIMVNNALASTSRIDGIMNRIIALLAAEN